MIDSISAIPLATKGQTSVFRCQHKMRAVDEAYCTACFARNNNKPRLARHTNQTECREYNEHPGAYTVQARA